MSDKKKKASVLKNIWKKTRKSIFKFARVLIICVLVFALVFLIVKSVGNVAVSNLTDSFRSISYSVKGDGEGYPLNFEEGKVTGISSVGKSPAIFIPDGFSVLGPKASVMLEEKNDLTEPILKSRNSRAVVYCVGETEYSIFSRTEKLGTVETEDEILTVAIGKKGNTAAATFAEDSKCILNVYNRKFEKVYSWNCSSYISCVALSDNGKGAAVVLTEVDDAVICSKLVLLDFDSEEIVNEFEYIGTSPLAVNYSGKTVSFLGDNLYSVVNKKEEKVKLNFESDTVKLFDVAENGNCAVVFDEMGNSSNQKLVLYSSDGEELFAQSLENETLDISCTKSYICVLSKKTALTFNNRGHIVGDIPNTDSFRSAEICDDKVFLFSGTQVEKKNVSEIIEEETEK